MAHPAYEFSHCIVCGHTDAAVIARQEDLRDEVEALWAFHQRRLRAGTPTDQLMDRVAFSQHAPLRLVRCTGCGLIYRNPVERPLELAEIYGGGAPATELLQSLHERQRPALRAQANELRRVMRRGGSVLEVGSYVGAFLAAARGAGLVAEGIDINADVNRFARSLGFTVHDGELETVSFKRSFDAVAIWNTFDQLPDPRHTVNAAAALVRPGGVLVVRVPNGDFYRRMRQGLASGQRLVRMAARTALVQNNLLGFPYRWGFTPRALRVLFAEHDFEVTCVRGDVLVPVGDEWTRRWARLEEMGVKAAMRMAARRAPERAPWIEVYARRVSG